MQNKKIKKIFSSFLLFLMGFLLILSPLLLSACSCNDETSSSIQVDPSFGGRSAYQFENINGSNVRVETFYNSQNEAHCNNPNIGQAVMLNNAIRYKKAHPSEDVYATITSFHFSVVASVCLDEKSGNYLKMKSLYDTDTDNEGFVRIAYLPIMAAKIGVNVIAIGQIDASSVWTPEGMKNDYSFEEYYNGYLDEESEIEGKKISDFLVFRACKWTSYGDKSATDMMHLKSSSVSHSRDFNGIDHGPAIWLGSINLDGVDSNGVNGNNNIQTAVIVSEHKELRNALYNYTKIMADYCEQEDVYEFRQKINLMNKNQIDLILSGKENQIPVGEQIVYLGGESDKIFELYLTPLGGSVNDWDERYNPYAKYISKLLPQNNGANNEITFAWGSAKYKDDSEFSKTLTHVLLKAFKDNTSGSNRLFLHLYDSEDQLDYSMFDSLVVGQNMSFKKFGGPAYHSKDFQLSYVENGTRYYVSVFNSLNFHQGSSAYQSNSFLVIKEFKEIGNNVYTDVGNFLSCGAINEHGRIK